MEVPSADVDHTPIMVFHELQIRAPGTLHNLDDLFDRVRILVVIPNGGVPATTSLSLRYDPLEAVTVSLREHLRDR